MSLQILIADDEVPARARLRALVEELGHEVYACVDNGSAALKALEDARVDVALLDIEMPGTDGLSLAAQMAREYPGMQVILVTAHPEYALRAFDAAVTDYVLKPVRKERLESALQRITQTPKNIPDDAPMIVIRIGRKTELVRLTALDCFVADGGYVLAQSVNLSGFIDLSLSEIEERWRTYLIRVHRSCLVLKAAIAGIERADRSTHRILFRDGFPPLPISRRKVAEIKDFLRTHEQPRPAVNAHDQTTMPHDPDRDS